MNDDIVPIWEEHSAFATTSPAPPLAGSIKDRALWTSYPLHTLTLVAAFVPVNFPHTRVLIRTLRGRVVGYEVAPVGRIILEADKTKTEWQAWAAFYVNLLEAAVATRDTPSTLCVALGRDAGALECIYHRGHSLECTANATLHRQMAPLEINLGLFVLRLAATALGVTMVKVERDHPLLCMGTLGPFDSLEFLPLADAVVAVKTKITTTPHVVMPADASQSLWDYALRHRTGFDAAQPSAPILTPVLLPVGKHDDATLQLLWTRFDDRRAEEWAAIRRDTDHEKTKPSPWLLTVMRYTHPLEIDAPHWAERETREDRAIITRTLTHISRLLGIVCMQDGQFVY